MSGRPYTPKTTTDFESHISFAAKKMIPMPLLGAVYIAIVFSFIKAKSSKKEMHTQKPDIDNLIKAVLDGLNKVAFVDDSQVVKLESEKQFAEQEGVNIYIQELNSEDKNKSKDKILRKKRT